MGRKDSLSLSVLFNNPLPVWVGQQRVTFPKMSERLQTSPYSSAGIRAGSYCVMGGPEAQWMESARSNEAEMTQNCMEMPAQQNRENE